MPISALPTPPSRSDSPQDFSDRADALLGALPSFVTEANALQSDVNAKESSVSSYATIATNKAAEAQGHATTASTKAGEAAASAIVAAAAANNAEIAFDSFDDKYLGSKTGDPTTDNDGNALLVGALYWNTTVGAVRVWNGSAWLSMAADASFVDFQQAGSGAVVRTAQDKMREWVSVKDFGAVGNGAANDTAAIQAAIDYASSLGGGRVLIPAGTYSCGLLYLKKNVALFGVSTDHTGHLGAATPGSCIKLANSANTALVNIPLLQHSIRLFDLTFDGNKANNPSGGNVIDFESCAPGDIALYSHDAYVTFERCTIWNGKAHGVSITPPHRAVRIFNSYIGDNDLDGVRIEASDCAIDGSLFGLNGLSNIRLVGASATHITNNDLFWADYGISIDVSNFFGSPMACQGALISNCGIDRAGLAGLTVSANAHTGISVVNTQFNGNSSDGAGLAPHVDVGSGVTSMSIIGCAFQDQVWTPPRPNYDIQVGGTSVVFVSGNMHHGANVSGTTNAPDKLRAGHASYYLDAAGKLVASRAEVSGFTKLGSDAPAVKMKELTGTTNSATAGTTSIAHGLTLAKILSVQVLVANAGGALLHPMYPDTTLQFSYYVSATDVVVVNGSTASALLSKPIRVLITYKE